MRRRPGDHRRSAARRRLSTWVWLLLASFSLAGFLLFIVQHHQHHYHQQEDPSHLILVCIFSLYSLLIFMPFFNFSSMDWFFFRYGFCSADHPSWKSLDLFSLCWTKNWWTHLNFVKTEHFFYPMYNIISYISNWMSVHEPWFILMFLFPLFNVFFFDRRETLHWDRISSPFKLHWRGR